MQLPKKTVVILGGAGLLGSEFARACASEGAHVIIADVNYATGTALARKIGATFMHANIAEATSLKKLVSEIKKKYSTIDGLVHAAYPKTKKYGAPIETADADDLLKNLDLQLGGPLLSTRAFMPILNKKASVIFLSSIYGVAAPRLEIYKSTKMKGVPAEYSAIKGGTIALTRFFAALLGKRGIRVNVISPGGIFDNQPKSFVRAYSQKAFIPPGMLSPKDIAGAVVFLLSDVSQKMTGQNMIIDGGWTL